MALTFQKVGAFFICPADKKKGDIAMIKQRALRWIIKHSRIIVDAAQKKEPLLIMKSEYDPVIESELINLLFFVNEIVSVRKSAAGIFITF